MACLRSGSERGGGCRLLGWAPSIHCNTFCRGPTILMTSLDSFRKTLSSGDGVTRFLSLCHILRLQGPHSSLGPRPLLPGTQDHSPFLPKHFLPPAQRSTSVISWHPHNPRMQLYYPDFTDVSTEAQRD